jgi:hypothetical protein
MGLDIDSRSARYRDNNADSVELIKFNNRRRFFELVRYGAKHCYVQTT